MVVRFLGSEKFKHKFCSLKLSPKYFVFPVTQSLFSAQIFLGVALVSTNHEAEFHTSAQI